MRQAARRTGRSNADARWVIPPNPTRKNPNPWDPLLYRTRNVIERMFCRLKDFRRIATRYDKRADTFLSAVLLAATVT